MRLGDILSEMPEKEEKDYLDSICFTKKHRGATWRQVLEEDPDYIRFLLVESDVKFSERLRDALMWALEEME